MVIEILIMVIYSLSPPRTPLRVLREVSVVECKTYPNLAYRPQTSSCIVSECLASSSSSAERFWLWVVVIWGSTGVGGWQGFSSGVTLLRKLLDCHDLTAGFPQSWSCERGSVQNRSLLLEMTCHHFCHVLVSDHTDQPWSHRRVYWRVWLLEGPLPPGTFRSLTPSVSHFFHCFQILFLTPQRPLLQEQLATSFIRRDICFSTHPKLSLYPTSSIIGIKKSYSLWVIIGFWNFSDILRLTCTE